MTHLETLAATRPELLPAARFLAQACEASREHSRLAESALALYGDHGPLVSGCVRSHFPEPVKDRLRSLARQVSRASAQAFDARPPRVRLATMRKLGRAVAAEQGSGYYGPQP